MESRAFFPFFLVLMFFSPFILTGEDDLSGQITVMIAEKTEVDNLNKSFLELLYNSLELELKIDGFVSFRQEWDELDKLYNLAIRKESSYIIDAAVNVTDDILTYVLTVYRTQRMEQIYNKSEEKKINFSLDEELRNSAETMVLQIRKDMQDHPESLFLKEEVEVRDVEKEEEKEILRNTQPVKPFSFSAGFAPFMTSGEASRYFTMGMAPEFHSSFNLENSSGYWSFGVFGSYNSVKAEGILFDADLQFLSVGPEIQYTGVMSRMMEVFYSLSGGITLLMIGSGSSEGEIITVPYGCAGLGMYLNFLPGFGMYLSMGYMIYFEQSIVISGFTPAIGLRMRV